MLSVPWLRIRLPQARCTASDFTSLPYTLNHPDAPAMSVLTATTSSDIDDGGASMKQPKEVAESDIFDETIGDTVCIFFFLRRKANQQTGTTQNKLLHEKRAAHRELRVLPGECALFMCIITYMIHS